MDCKRGFTLIEVMISIVIISIVFIAFLSFFGSSTVGIIKGRDITKSTFTYQDNIENEILKIKKEFVDNTISKDYDISIFSGDYEAKVDVKEINQKIEGSRYYRVLVSNVKIPELPSPKITNLKAEINPNSVFPWKDNVTSINAEYKISSDPKIANIRTRWYRTTENVDGLNYKDIVFPSGYEVIKESEIDEPTFLSNSENITTTDNLLEGDKFYYFEVRAYTFAGKLGYFMNSDRIVVLERKGSAFWQNLMEEIFKKNLSIYVKEGTVLEIFQNPYRPTLNLGSNVYDDSQGPMMTTNFPSEYIDKSFKTSITFQADSVTRERNPDKQGIGIFIGQDSQSGIMYTFDVKNDKLIINNIESGIYTSLIQEINLNDITEFNDTNARFNWNGEYKFHIERIVEKVEEHEIVKIEMSLEGENNLGVTNSIKIGEAIIEPSMIAYNKIGLKSYTSLKYQPETSEIVGKYTRNYGGHFFDILFE